MMRVSVLSIAVALLLSGCLAGTRDAPDVAVPAPATPPAEPVLDEPPEPADEPADTEKPDSAAGDAQLVVEPASFRLGENATLRYRHGAHEARDSCWWAIEVVLPHGNASIGPRSACLLAIWPVEAGELVLTWNGTVWPCPACPEQRLAPGTYNLTAHVRSTEGSADVASATVTIEPAEEEPPALRVEPGRFVQGENATLVYRYPTHHSGAGCPSTSYFVEHEGHELTIDTGRYCTAVMAWSAGGVDEVRWNGEVVRCDAGSCEGWMLPPGTYRVGALTWSSTESGREKIGAAWAEVQILPAGAAS